MHIAYGTPIKFRSLWSTHFQHHFSHLLSIWEPKWRCLAVTKIHLGGNCDLHLAAFYLIISSRLHLTEDFKQNCAQTLLTQMQKLLLLGAVLITGPLNSDCMITIHFCWMNLISDRSDQLTPPLPTSSMIKAPNLREVCFKMHHSTSTS